MDNLNENNINQQSEEQVQKDESGITTEKKLTLKGIFLGDFLITDFLRRQSARLVLITIFTVIYIGNRYSCQQEMIEIDRLKKELTDIKYDALTRSSELMEKSRQSRIEEYISTEESHLETSTSRPFLIKKD